MSAKHPDSALRRSFQGLAGVTVGVGLGLAASAHTSFSGLGAALFAVLAALTGLGGVRTD